MSFLTRRRRETFRSALLEAAAVARDRGLLTADDVFLLRWRTLNDQFLQNCETACQEEYHERVVAGVMSAVPSDSADGAFPWRSLLEILIQFLTALLTTLPSQR